MIGNGRGLLDEKGLGDVAMATGGRDSIATGKGLLWRWGIVAMVIRKGCYGNLVTIAMVM